MFTPTSHPLVGSTARYLPAEYPAVTAAEARAEHGAELITFPGDVVDVLSAWTRDYLPADAPTLLYVRSHETGQCTHLSEFEVVA